MKIRSDFVTNSSSSSFTLIINMDLVDKQTVRFEANGGTDETGRIDYFRHDAIVKVSPKQLAQVENVDALIQMLEDGVVDGQVDNYDESYENKIFDQSRVVTNDWDEEYDAYDFVKEIRETISDMSQIKKITISGEEDGDSYYYREYVYDVENEKYTGKQIGKAFQANGTTGGDLRLSDLDSCEITYHKYDGEEEEEKQEEDTQKEDTQEAEKQEEDSQEEKNQEEVEDTDSPKVVETEDGAIIDNIKYAITSETTCKVIGSEGWFKEAIIPGEVTIKGKQYKVTAVGAKAFSVGRFERVELPVGIIEIEDNALECWYLKSVKLPEGLTVMGNMVFNCCRGIETVEIPDSVKSIGRYAFRGCENLKNVKLPRGIEELNDSLFCDCKSLESVEIPDSVKKLNEGIFYGCEKLKNVKLPAELTEIDRLMFYECKSLESIEIPDTVKSIGDYAFYKCEKLTTVDLPSGVSSLGEGTFKGCLALNKIELPQGLTELGDMAFADCPSLGEVV